MGSVPRDELLGAAHRSARQTGTGPRTGQLARRHWLACLRQRLHLGGEGKEAGELASSEGRRGGFTTLKRVGIPPEPFPHLAGSCENNSLAFTLSLCRSQQWVSSVRSSKSWRKWWVYDLLLSEYNCTLRDIFDVFWCCAISSEWCHYFPSQLSALLPI